MAQPARNAKDLLVLSKEYAHEERWQSWWHLCSTLCIYGLLVTITCLDLPLSWRLLSSIASGLVIVRLFVIYHDYQHGTILRNSRIAAGIMYLYGVFALSPPSIWNRSHNHHHQNNSKVFGASIGSYPLMTVAAYADASHGERIRYAASRHPLNIALGYFTMFIYGMCIRSLLTNPRRHLDSALTILVHLGLAAWLATLGWDVLWLVLIAPLAIASAFGAYLFYAQHNFPSAKIGIREEWNYVFAALHSSSYIRMSPVMHWFTGNIGYHHVHHLNAHIPFYRLPEAMAGIVELQSPRTTSLRPRDIMRCLRLKLWDTESDRLVSFSEAAPSAARDDLACQTAMPDHRSPLDSMPRAA